MASCVRFLVNGRVQGVGFRAATARQAREIGVRGWVSNLPDGRVEVFAAASPESLERFAAWLRQGPPAARVTSVEQSPAENIPLPDHFGIR